MRSLSGKILDINDDPDVGLVKQAAQEGVSIPAFVLQYGHQPATGPLEDSLYAFVHYRPSGEVIKKYACDNPAATWLSGLYFVKNGHAFPEPVQKAVAQKLAGFYQVHGLDCPALIEKIAKGEETVPMEWALPDHPVTEDLFALTRTSETPLYPIVTWDHVKQAQDYFLENCLLFAPAQRREFCVKLANRTRVLARDSARQGGSDSDLEKSAALALQTGRDPVEELAWEVRLYASQTPDESQIADALSHRVKIAQAHADEKAVEAYKLLWDNRGSFTLDKFAEAIETIDRYARIDNLWGRQVADPYVSILKIATGNGDEIVFDESGVTLTRNQVRKLASKTAEIGRLFDPEMARELANDTETVFQSLPLPEKKALADLVR